MHSSQVAMSWTRLSVSRPNLLAVWAFGYPTFSVQQPKNIHHQDLSGTDDNTLPQILASQTSLKVDRSLSITV